MSEERRRYFRINETIGIAYRAIDDIGVFEPVGVSMPNVLEVFGEQDHKLEKLLMEVADSHPKVAELVTIFNQKLERVVNQLTVESKLLSRIAEKVREVNISACGVAFVDDESLPVNSAVALELTLLPSRDKIQSNARVIGCEPYDDGTFYVRLDFYGMNVKNQEQLIQHMVKRQSSQIKELRS